MEPRRRSRTRSIIMICLILAFIVGVAIGVTQILDFKFSSDENNGDNVTYVDVTNNVQYYENMSQKGNGSADYGSDDSDYNDPTLKVSNASSKSK